MDLSVNGPLKERLKNSFTDWYADRVQKAIEDNSDNIQAAVDSLQPDLRLSVLKPLHARWMMDALAELTVNRQLVFQGWEASGIFGALQTIHNGATSCRTKEEDATKNEEEQTQVAKKREYVETGDRG